MTKYDEYRSDKVLFYLEGVRNGRRTFPPSMQIAITDYCFNKCIMCGHWKRKDKRELIASDLIKFLDKAVAKGLDTVCYSGGDPLAHRSINRIMEWHINNHVPFGIITSGFVPNNVDMWLLSHAEWVRISLDAIGIDLYEHIRGGIPVEAVRRSIALMGEQGVNVQFGITMSKLNYLELPALADYAKHIGATSFRVWPVRNNPALEVPSAQGITVLTKCRQIVNTMDNNIVDAINILLYGESTEFDHCFACLFQMFVDATGDIYPCCIHAGDAMDSPQNTHTFGNIMETDLDMVYCFAKEFSRSNKLPEACKGCTKRLQTINHLSASRWNDKHFI